MSAGDFLIVAALMMGFFWIVGKLFLKALKFILIAAVGAAVVAAVVLSPIWLMYGAVAAAYGAYAYFAKGARPAAQGSYEADEGEQ